MKRSPLRSHNRITPALFLFPSLTLYSVFTIGTLFYSFVLSLTDWDGLSKKINFIGLRNFIRLFQDVSFYNAFKNNIIWAVVSLLLPMFLGLFLAVLIDKKIKGENIFKSIYYLPQTLSFVVIAVIWAWIYDPKLGILNTSLRAIGLDSLTQNWIGNTNLTIFSIILAGSWQLTGYSMVLYLAGLRSISTELLEAAVIDGATPWQSFWRITYPLLRNVRTVVMATIIINSFKIFDLVFTMTQGGPADASNVLAMFMYKEAFWKFNMSYGTTISVIQFFIILIIVLIYLKRSMKTEGDF